ncbi:dihydroneopterin aldolase [Halosquirtibacter xylanolyticus]|uniref:dihydroneopterin aldolase n=1 Tax=Halosquirtibacter xylanolyticus TaxID=3374599 RepID=UPI003749B7B9|nr:dihydroneopterin aldolase [Prolixibacteraceae bacterium]
MQYGVIEIEDMYFHAYHGHFEEEQVVGNNFIVYAHIETDCLAASKSDELDDALNYLKAYELIQEEMQIPSKLLEHVTGRILDRLYGEFGDQIKKVKIKVSKLNPPMGGQIGSVSVTQER